MHQYEVDIFRARAGKLPDLEKSLANIFKYSIKNKVKAIYFEDVSLIKLKEFRLVTKTLKDLHSLITAL